MSNASDKATISPLDLMKAAAATEPKVETETKVEATPVKTIGPAYRLPGAPCTIIYEGTRHTYPDGIVHCLTKEFAEFMKTLAASGGAIELSEQGLKEVEAEIKAK